MHLYSQQVVGHVSREGVILNLRYNTANRGNHIKKPVNTQLEWTKLPNLIDFLIESHLQGYALFSSKPLSILHTHLALMHVPGICLLDVMDG